MSTQYWTGGKLPGRVEFADGWVAYTEPGAPWGCFLANAPDGHLYMFELPKEGSMVHTQQVRDDDGELTGFFVWAARTDPVGTVRIARHHWD